MIKNTTN